MAGRQFSHRNEGSATLGPAGTRLPERLTAVATAAVAFYCYYSTLLPGLDLGDSASFQTGVGSLTLTPRQAYPLYYALGNVFVWLHPGEPARAMNFASAVYAAVAVGLATILGARLWASGLAGVASGLLLAFSYTFWSQAITAEVYTLHLAVVGAAILAMLSWSEEPGALRLAAFYAVFALGFGNHLSMILLMPAFVAFLLVKRRPGNGDPLRPAMIAVAVLIAATAAMQYAWNFRGLWSTHEPPASLAEGAVEFWVDVTKADWRETLVMNVSEAGLQSRPSMYWFDLCQQFGVAGVALALVGIGYAAISWPSRALLLSLAYAANLAFAWTYNVGDAYVFFLPSHYVVALCAGGGIAAIIRTAGRMPTRGVATAVGILALVYPAWRAYDTWPAVDRAWDTRAERLLDEFTSLGHAAIHGVDTNWQVQNALEYFMRTRKPGVGWFTTEELEWLQRRSAAEGTRDLIVANSELGRRVVVTPAALRKLRSNGFDGTATDVHDDRLDTHVATLQQGTPYVLAVLRPDREYSLDGATLAAAWRTLTAGEEFPDLHQYTVAVGRAGTKPVLLVSEDRPYRVQSRLDALAFDIRMESWLPTDTIRRAGFGHVIVGRQHVLTLERGVSFVALGPGGGPLYSSGLFAAIPRHILGMRGQ